MKKISAGILFYRTINRKLEVFLVHPGGPFFAKKDLGVWSIPKGEIEEEEDILAAAKRECKEETGFEPEGIFLPLSPVTQKSGKIVYVWAVEKDIDPSLLKSNLFSMEWPPKSGKQQQFPEVDRGAWFSIEQAKEKINSGQVGLLEEVEKYSDNLDTE